MYVLSIGTAYPHAEWPHARHTTQPPSCARGAPHSGHDPAVCAVGDSSWWTNNPGIESPLTYDVPQPNAFA